LLGKAWAIFGIRLHGELGWRCSLCLGQIYERLLADGRRPQLAESVDRQSVPGAERSVGT
jgi:hypothetical protein